MILHGTIGSKLHSVAVLLKERVLCFSKASIISWNLLHCQAEGRSMFHGIFVSNLYLIQVLFGVTFNKFPSIGNIQ